MSQVSGVALVALSASLVKQKRTSMLPPSYASLSSLQPVWCTIPNRDEIAKGFTPDPPASLLSAVDEVLVSLFLIAPSSDAQDCVARQPDVASAIFFTKALRLVFREPQHEGVAVLNKCYETPPIESWAPTGVLERDPYNVYRYAIEDEKDCFVHAAAKLDTKFTRLDPPVAIWLARSPWYVEQLIALHRGTRLADALSERIPRKRETMIKLSQYGRKVMLEHYLPSDNDVLPLDAKWSHVHLQRAASKGNVEAFVYISRVLGFHSCNDVVLPLIVRTGICKAALDSRSLSILRFFRDNLPDIFRDSSGKLSSELLATAMRITCGVPVLRFLREMGVDVEQPIEGSSMYPIHIAANRTSMDMLRFLVEECNINIDTKMRPGGGTALHIALTKFSTLNAAVFLLKHGADPRIRNDNGKLMLDAIDSLKELDASPKIEEVEELIREKLRMLDEVAL